MVIPSDEKLQVLVEDLLLLAKGEIGDKSIASNGLNQKARRSVSYDLMKPLGDHSRRESLNLSLKHRLKVFLITLTITHSVCLTSFGFSKHPRTKTRTKNVVDIGCTLFNKLVLLGLNHVVNSVSTRFNFFI